MPTLDEVSRNYARDVIRECNGNMTQAATVLGLDRRTLYRHVTEWFGSVDNARKGENEDHE